MLVVWEPGLRSYTMAKGIQRIIRLTFVAMVVSSSRWLLLVDDTKFMFTGNQSSGNRPCQQGWQGLHGRPIHLRRQRPPSSVP